MAAQPKDKCPGHTRAGNPCSRTAGYGTDHLGFGLCKNHGGSSPGGRKQGQRLAAEAAVANYGLPREIDPVDALLEEINRTAGHIDFITAQIRELDPQALVWGVAEIKHVEASEFSGTDVTEKAAVNVWVDLYLRERKHLVDVCKAALSAGIELRRVKLAEQQGELAGQWLRAILTGLDLLPEQRRKVPGLVRQHLALIQGGAA